MKKTMVVLAVLSAGWFAAEAWAGAGCCGAKKQAGQAAGCAVKAAESKTETDAAGCAGAVAGSKAQVTCPVMGGPIRKDVFADHDGKRVYLCCGACVDSFKAEPEKYVKKLEEAGVELEQVPAEQ